MIGFVASVRVILKLMTVRGEKDQSPSKPLTWWHCSMKSVPDAKELDLGLGVSSQAPPMRLNSMGMTETQGT